LLAPSAARVEAQASASPDWDLYGDFRLRYEETTKQEPGSTPGSLQPRHRAVVRFRAGVARRIGDLVTVSARVATGASGDPNTADVTLGEFVDDLEISLDRVYLDFKRNGMLLTGGKFANPFVKTGLVWDDDVNPEGIAASYTFGEIGTLAPKVTGIYSIIDEQTVNPDSYMLGGQIALGARPAPSVTVTLAGAYYDYTVKSLRNADAGDTLSNLLTPDRTAYLSDFDLLNAIAILEYRGMGTQYPVLVVGDFAKNLGAAVADDQAFSLEVGVGRTSAPRDLRVRYGFSRTETDAVLAAFSNDDTTYATNYLQHSVTVDYVPANNTVLTVNWFLYRRPGSLAPDNEFISRLRANVAVSF
jgi:hypothetical protein